MGSWKYRDPTESGSRSFPDCHMASIDAHSPRSLRRCPSSFCYVFGLTADSMDHIPASRGGLEVCFNLGK